jgi:small-conductance mechanosensitive channel
MNTEDLFGTELFSIGKMVIDLGQLLRIVGAVGGLSILAVLLLKYLLPRFYGRDDTSSELRPRARRVILSGVVVFSIIAILRVLNLDFELYNYQYDFEDDTFIINIRISTLMKALLILSVAGLVDWFIEEFLVQWYHRNRPDDRGVGEDMAQRVSITVRPVVYTVALLIVVSDIHASYIYLFALARGTDHETPVFLHNLISAALVLFIVRLLVLFVTRFALAGYYRRSKVDQGSQYALNRLLSYFAYLFGVLLVLQTAGFNLLGIWTGAAALLVGIGIGLQQTFNDLVCGVIILFERSVKVGDVLDMANLGKIGTVKKIGARTSQVEDLDGILVFVPNSKLIGDSVVNWSQTDRRARFHVQVGVAYGSDTELVKKILLEAAEKHPRVMKLPAPNVRFLDFGESSLDFDVMFFTRDFRRVEDTRSDLRFTIDNEFRKHKVEIPFPQRDLWIKNSVQIQPRGGGEEE